MVIFTVRSNFSHIPLGRDFLIELLVKGYEDLHA